MKKGSSFSTTSHRDTYRCSVKVYLFKGGYMLYEQGHVEVFSGEDDQGR
jgi:hypothetical protein